MKMDVIMSFMCERGFFQEIEVSILFEEIILILGENGEIKHANERACTVYGYSYDEITKMKFEDLRIKRMPYGYEIHKRKDSSTLEVRVYAQKIYDFNVVVIRESEKTLLHSLVNDLPFGVLIINREERCVYANASTQKMLGWTKEELMGKSIHDLLYLGELRISKGISAFQAAFSTEETYNQEWTFVCKNGSPFHALVFSVPISEFGETSGTLILFQSNDENNSISHLRFVAYHDELTRLPNRSLLRDRIEQAIRAAKRSDEKIAILFLDLDQFKRVNDSFGHRAGDALLHLVAQRLKTKVRDSDTVARPGGDEFIIVLRAVHNARDAARVAEKIIQSLSRPFVVGKHKVVISTSIGISLYPDDGANVDELIHKADMAMYEAKASGQGMYAFYNISADERMQSELRLENEIRAALERNEFKLYYQPIIDLHTNEVTSAEALIRWHHPKRGLILPDEFIPVAEESLLINHIGKWTLEAACRQIHAWKENGASMSVSVNVTAAQFQHEEFVSTLRKTLHKFKIKPRDLILELTERVVMREDEEIKTTINELDSVGIHFSLDDFGTGYSNLKYLSVLPIDILKIDRSFVEHMIDSPKDKRIVEAIVDLGKHLKLKTIAEGVESQEQVEILKHLGCNAAQGYYFSPPLKAEEFCHEYVKH